MPLPPVTLVLFDIDGTLVHMDGAGRKAFSRTLHRVFGWRDSIGYINFAGATDLQVVTDVLERNGRTPIPADVDRFFTLLPEAFAETLAEAKPVLFPGVPELLNRLAEDPDYLLGLVTGNIETCARQKLARFRLQGHFQVGAFGHEHADRNRIARLALGRAEAHLAPDRRLGRRFLIGDTPSDVRAAHAIGALAVAVATGTFSEDQLRDAGADTVVPDLADTDALLRWLTGPPASSP